MIPASPPLFLSTHPFTLCLLCYLPKSSPQLTLAKQTMNMVNSAVKDKNIAQRTRLYESINAGFGSEVNAGFARGENSKDDLRDVDFDILDPNVITSYPFPKS